MQVNMFRLALILLLFLSSCTTIQVEISWRQKNYKPSDYGRILSRWTRDVEVYRGLENIIHAQATLMSWDYQQAFAAFSAKRYGLRGREVQAYYAKLKARTARQYEFFLAITGSTYRWGDIKASDWHLTLEDDRGRFVRPLKITLIRPARPRHKVFFPYLTIFSNAYRIVFPRIHPQEKTPLFDDKSKYIILKFSGPLGNGSMRWKIGKSKD